MRRRSLIMGVAAVAAGGAFFTRRAFRSDLAAARERLEGRSLIAATRFGGVEYAVAGSGRPALMIHGAGGGFDQGLHFSSRLAASGRSIIAPSRFGYLRSSYPDDPSSENQADAFVDLLDALGIDRAPIIGGSAGALSAMAFAIRHPERCAALVVLVPAAYAPGRPPVRPPGPLAAAIIEHALKSDFLFWSGMTFAEDAMIAALLATDPKLVKAAPEEERARVRTILRNILPVSGRSRGFANDARLAGNPAPMPIETIRTPTLAVSFEDDRFQTFAAARHVADAVPNADLLSYPTGGHVWVGHDAEIFRRIGEFLDRAEP